VVWCAAYGEIISYLFPVQPMRTCAEAWPDLMRGVARSAIEDEGPSGFSIEGMCLPRLDAHRELLPSPVSELNCG